MHSSEGLAAGRPPRRLPFARRGLLPAVGALLLLGACVPKTAPVTAPTPPDRASVLRRDLEQIFGPPPGGSALWGVRIESLDHPGTALFTLNADRLLVPASNMKLLTTAAAASRLGWERTFPTTISSTTAMLADGTVHGDLVVSGTGDPTIGNRQTSASTPAAIADALYGKGLRRVEGRVVGDDRWFADEPLGEGWAWDDLAFSYSAPISGLVYNENIAAVRISPGASAGMAAATSLQDWNSGLIVHSRVVTTAPGTTSNVDVARMPGANVVQLSGSIAADAPPITRYLAVASPARYFAGALRSALLARGVVVDGEAADGAVDPAGPLPPNVPPLLVWQSPTLDVIATRLLKVSQNLYAETLLRELGASGSQRGSAEGGEAVVRDVLDGWGIARSAYSVSDGSGLSRYNLVTPSAFVQLLTAVYKEPRLRDQWLAALPTGGADGTLGHRLNGTPAEGRVHAKTGSLTSVRTLSGYVQTIRGEWIVFSMLANNFADPVTPADVEAVMDKALVRLTAY